MLSVVVLVGRPNVGKSTLFNRLTKSQDALVADMPGLTRDRQYGFTCLQGHRSIIVDTGGLAQNEDPFSTLVQSQTDLAINEADVLLFVLDASVGVTAEDERIAQRLRLANKPIFLVVNKIDGQNTDTVLSDFYALGMGEPMAVAALHGRGIQQLWRQVVESCHIDEVPPEAATDDASAIAIAIIGKPNAGKSTLTNRLLTEERMLVSEVPGTTRDSISHDIMYKHKPYRIIDTAGVRRRTKVNEVVEKFSVAKTLCAIDECDVALLLIDATEGVSEQDLKLLAHVLDAGKALVIALNKWDDLDDEQREDVLSAAGRQLHFASFIKSHHISARKGRGLNALFKSIDLAYQSSVCDIPSAKVTDVVSYLLEQHPPPLTHGRRVKIRYAHMGGHQPPTFVMHGNQTEKLSLQYQRYLQNGLREHFSLEGTTVRLKFKSGENPFSDRKNTLNARQIKKRQRLMKHIKKNKK